MTKSNEDRMQQRLEMDLSTNISFLAKLPVQYFDRASQPQEIRGVDKF